MLRIYVFIGFVAFFSDSIAQSFVSRWQFQVNQDKASTALALPDDEKGMLLVQRISQKLRIDGVEYEKAADDLAVIIRNDSFGRSKWKKTIRGKGNWIPQVAPMLVGNTYCVAASSNDVWRVGPDSVIGSGVFGIDKQGVVKFITPLPGEIQYKPSVSLGGKLLLKSLVRALDTMNGKIYVPGFWILEVDTAGRLTREIHLGQSQTFYSYYEIGATDSNIVFTGYASINRPFIGNGWQIRALDSNSRPGGNSSDQFIACLNNNGQLKWMHRLDTMSYSGDPSKMVLLKNGKIIWCPDYYKSGQFLGYNINVKFRGGSYPLFIEINLDGGAIVRFKRPTEVQGGSNNGVKVFTDSRFIKLIVACRGGDSTGGVLSVPKDDWVPYFTGLIYYDSNFNYLNKVSIPDYYFSAINLHRTNYLVHNTFFSGLADSERWIEGINYKNQMGNDLLVGNYTTEKFTKLASVNKLNSGEVLLYPNPASHQFMVLNKLDNWKTVSVFDAQGRNCGMLQAENGKWNIGHLLPGMYMLQFEGDTGMSAWSKLLISR